MPKRDSSPSSNGFKPGRGALAVILLASMMVLMGGAAIGPALPVIGAAFPDVSETMLSLLITLPPLAVAIFGFGIGALADRIGKVRLFACSFAVFTLAGISGYFLNDIGTILAGRFILGIGLAGISVCSTALVTEYYHGEARARVIGLQSAAMGVGILVLESGGGLLAELGWHMPFLVYLVGAPGLLGIALWMREPDRKPAGRAAEAAAPAIDRRTTIRVVAACLASIFLLEILAFLFPAKLPYYVTQLGGSSGVSGIFLGIHGVCLTLASLLYRRMSGRLGLFAILLTGFALIGICCVLLFAVPLLPMTLFAACLGGGGIGLVIPTLVHWISSVTTPQTSGKIMGAYSTMLNLAQFVSSLVLGAIMLFTDSYQVLFLIMGLFALAACIIYAIALLRAKAKA